MIIPSGQGLLLLMVAILMIGSCRAVEAVLLQFIRLLESELILLILEMGVAGDLRKLIVHHANLGVQHQVVPQVVIDVVVVDIILPELVLCLLDLLLDGF
jgi:hypothetical protein